MAAHRPCDHCGTPFVPRRPEDRFCCNGCAYVYRMLREEGFGQFYDFKGEVIQPVGSRAFSQPDWARIEPAIQRAEAAAKAIGGDTARTAFRIEGISCIGCVWLVERLFQRIPGGIRINIDAQTSRIEMHWRIGVFDPRQFIEAISPYGYILAPVGDAPDNPESRALGVRIGLTGAFAMNTMLFTLPVYLGMEASFPFARLFSMVALASATFSMILGGSYFIVRAFNALRDRYLHADVPIALGLVIAYGGSLLGWLLDRADLQYFDFVSIFSFLMLAGRWAQESAIERNRRLLLEDDIREQSVLPVTGEGSAPGTRHAVGEITPGDRFRAETHLLVPVESRVDAGSIECSLESINGESLPRVFIAGDRIPAGARILNSCDAVLEAIEKWEDSLLARLTSPAEESDLGRRWIDRLIRPYTAIVLTLAAVGGFAWAVQTDWVRGAAVAISILVVSCPCALGVSLPLAGQLAISRLRRDGIFVRRIDLLARLRKVRRVVFDKTGTLTLERLRLRNPEALHDLSANDADALIAMTNRSLHPVARSLREELLARGCGTLQRDPGFAFDETPGLGITLRQDNTLWHLGRPDWAGDSRDPGEGTVLSRNGIVITRFLFREEVREDVRPALASLQRQGLDLVLLSGDHPSRVDGLNEALGHPFTTALGGLSPDDKAAWIATHDPDPTLMIGDGLNDRLAFDQAGCRGSPIVEQGALRAATDFLFSGFSLGPIPRLFAQARRYRHTFAAILVAAILYNGFAVSLCLAGVMNPLLAAVLMPASSLLSLALASRAGRQA